MTKALKKAFGAASRLPDPDQDELAATTLEEPEADERWEAAFAGSQDALERLPTKRWKSTGRAGSSPLIPMRLGGNRRHEGAFDFSKLSIGERIQLAEDLWESIPEEVVDLPLTEAQRAELDHRLEDLEHHPDAGEPWEVVRGRLYERLKRGE